MFPVVLHVAIAAPSAFRSGITQEGPQLMNQQDARGSGTLLPRLLPPPAAESAPELSMKSSRRHGCMLTNRSARNFRRDQEVGDVVGNGINRRGEVLLTAVGPQWAWAAGSRAASPL